VEDENRRSDICAGLFNLRQSFFRFSERDVAKMTDLTGGTQGSHEAVDQMINLRPADLAETDGIHSSSRSHCIQPGFSNRLALKAKRTTYASIFLRPASLL
jgi:hypothetical protein